MKKLLFKMVLLVGLMLLVPYYMLGGGTLPGFLQGIFKSGKQAPATTNMSSVTTDKEVTMYKCTDTAGHIEYSQSPCLGNMETIRLQPNVNVVQRTNVPEAEMAESGGSNVIVLGNSDKADAAKDKKTGTPEIGNPYDPENVQKLIKDAQNVGKLMEQHAKQIDTATGTQK